MPTRSAAFDAFLLLCLAWLIWLFAAPVLTIPLQIPINYNEGYNAALDMRAVIPGAGPLYPVPGPDSFVFNNYPPLGFYIVGWFGRLVTGDMIVGGRIVALVSLLGAGVLVGLWVRQLGGTGRAAVAAGLLLLLFVGDYYRTYVAMDDPQWLAHATMCAGLAVLLRGGALARLRTATGVPAAQVAAACLLMVAGGFIKHNLVALPLATTVWLLWMNRRAGAVWAATAVVGLAVGVAAMWWLYGPAAFTDIFRHKRLFRPVLLLQSPERLAPMLAMMVVAAVLLRRRTGGDGAVLAGLFAAIALVTGVFQRMGEGVYYNAHFETLIALCLCTGLVLSPVLAAPARFAGRTFTATELLFLAVTPMLGALPWHLPYVWNQITERHALEDAWRPVIARMAAARGPIGCQFMSVCYWAGQPSRVDLFNFTQSVLTGGSLDGFASFVRNRGFAMFEDDPASFLHKDAVRQLGHDPVMGSFNGTYETVYTGPKGIVLLAPIPAGSAATARP